MALIEEKKDYTEEASKILPLAQEIAQSGRLQEALELLFTLEKKCRQGNDQANLKEAILLMIRLCRAENNWEELNKTLQAISKKRSQWKGAITTAVQEAMTFIDQTPDTDTKEKLVEVLRNITDGKIYLESERAKLTKMLADLKEAAGNIAAAADIIQDANVETYGSLTKKEKAEFILEQIRMTLLKGDFIRAFIISKKINRKTLQEPDFQELKLHFFQLMIDYHQHEHNAWELCHDFYNIFDTPCVQQNDSQWKEALKNTIGFLVLSPFTNEQQDFLHRISKEKKLQEIPAFRGIVESFKTKEIIPYPLTQQSDIMSLEVMSQTHWQETLHTRVVQHSIRVVAGYYKRIRMSRLAQLLQLSEDQTERTLSDMVSEASLFAKIDRPNGIISFVRPKPAETILSDWGNDISQLLTLVENTCHLIHKENMIYKV